MIASLRLFAAAVALAFAACTFGSAGLMDSHLPCNSDAECVGEQVCFPDGCGDPGRDIVVEVVPGAATGQLAQDFAVEKVAPTLDFQAFAPPVIQGVLTQTSTTMTELPYNGEVSVRVSGESMLIPGRSRSFQYTVQPNQGAYQVPVASGSYTITLTPTEQVLPPRIETDRLIRPGDVHELNEWFPNVTALRRVDGRLVLTAQSNLALQSEMDVQAFHPVTQAPLSQKARVSAGSTTSTGDFYLYVEQNLGLEEILLRATPHDPAALVPSKTFVVPLTLRTPDPLEMGDFGAPVIVTGRVLDSAGQPVAGATVYLDGRVNGGGSFRSPRGSTDATGAFSVETLASAPGGTLTLFAVPPADSDAGLLRVEVAVSASALDLGQFVTPDKIVVTGSLVGPDDKPADGVIVRAEPVARLDDHPLPSATTETTTDGGGSFTIKLSPAIYRLDFLPTDFNPRVSRFVTVRETPSASGGAEPMQLPAFQLSRGRTVIGTISSIPHQLSVSQDPVPAPNAAVKFFRIVSFEGKQSHVLLADGLADANGNYSVVLPTR